MASNPYVNKVQLADGTSVIDISDTTATASDVASGKCFYTAAGVKAEGTASGGGGGGLTLLQTTSLGTLSTSSTSATDTGKTLSLASSTGWTDYDLLIVDVSVDSITNNRHTSTVSLVLVTGQSDISTKSNFSVSGNKWNSKVNSSGTASSRQSTTAYGIYASSVNVSSNTMSILLYYKYNSTNTGTINGSYTARVYGVKLIDLIGG